MFSRCHRVDCPTRHPSPRLLPRRNRFDGNALAHSPHLLLPFFCWNYIVGKWTCPRSWDPKYGITCAKGRKGWTELYGLVFSSVGSRESCERVSRPIGMQNKWIISTLHTWATFASFSLEDSKKLLIQHTLARIRLFYIFSNQLHSTIN